MAKNKNDYEIQTRLSGLYVLVVDDSEFDRELAIANLRKLGVRDIQIAENGSVATRKMQNAIAVRKPFDIVFLDAKMPSQDGLSFLKWLRSDRVMNTKNVIVMTGTSEMEDIREFIQQGVKAFVIKPVSAKILEEKVFEVLQIEKRNAG